MYHPKFWNDPIQRLGILTRREIMAENVTTLLEKWEKQQHFKTID